MNFIKYYMKTSQENKFPYLIDYSKKSSITDSILSIEEDLNHMFFIINNHSQIEIEIIEEDIFLDFHLEYKINDISSYKKNILNVTMGDIESQIFYLLMDSRKHLKNIYQWPESKNTYLLKNSLDENIQLKEKEKNNVKKI